MEIKNIYKSLREFVIAATGYPGDKVVFANQLSNARPKKPFITIDIDNFKNIGTPIIKNTTKDNLTENIVSMIFTASFMSFSDKEHESEDILETLHIKLSSELQNDIFQGEIATRKTLLKTNAIPKVLNEQFESRSILEVEMGFNKSTTNKVDIIETVDIDALINNYNKEITITKGI